MKKTLFAFAAGLCLASSLNAQTTAQNGVKVTSSSTSTTGLLRVVKNDYIGLGVNSQKDILQLSSSGRLMLTNQISGSSFCIGNGWDKAGTPRFCIIQNYMYPHVYVDFYENMYFRGDHDNETPSCPLVLQKNGSVGIGYRPTYTTNQDHTKGYKLAVNGSIHAKSIDVDLNGWADYVFDENYDLKSIDEVASYVKENKHLPGVKSAEEMTSKSVNLGDNQQMLMQKIEELTLYIIELNNRIKELESK